MPKHVKRSCRCGVSIWASAFRAILCAVLVVASLTWSTPAYASSQLSEGDKLYPGEQIVLGNYALKLQSDGNLVLRWKGNPLWSTRTNGITPAWLAMQTDGNLVLYKSGGGSSWNAGTSGSFASYPNEAFLTSTGDFCVRSCNVNAPITKFQSRTADGPYQFYRPDDENPVAYYSVSGDTYPVPPFVGAGFDDALNYVDTATDFNTSRTFTFTSTTDIFVRYLPMPKNYAETECIGGLVGRTCGQFRISVNASLSHPNFPVLALHETGHTLDLADHTAPEYDEEICNKTPPNKSYGCYESGERTAMRGTYSFYYSARERQYLNNLYP